MKNLIIGTVSLLVVALLPGCNDQTSAEAQTGSLAVNLIWPGAENQDAATRSFSTRSLMPDDAVTIRARISGSGMNTIEKDFPAADRQGSITGVPVGDGRRLHVQALDTNGELLASCVISGLIVEVGETTYAGDCTFMIARQVLKPEMVAISAGCFDMGSPVSEEYRNEDEVLHNVCVNAFKMGKHEVTHAEFIIFLNEVGLSQDRENEPWIALKSELSFSPIIESNSSYQIEAGFEEYPVRVAWFGAQAYAEWLSSKTGESYRLPTEAEWEYATRAGTSTPYFFGNDESMLCQYANFWDQSAGHLDPVCDDGIVGRSPVGLFEANPWGVFDLYGSYHEWTCSEYVLNYDGAELECISRPDGSQRLAYRGGYWGSPPDQLRSARRFSGSPSSTNFDRGFRLIQD